MKHCLLALLSIGFLLTGCGGGGGGGETASGSSGYNTTTAPAGGTTAVADPVLNGQFTAGGSPAAASLEQTLTVTVQAVGNANKYFIDGAQQSELSLEVGTTYTLDQSDASNAGHPLRFSITDDGTHSGGVEYTTDITTNGTAGQAGAYTKITPTAATPALLYYYCTNHTGMGGQADVTNVAGGNNAAVNGVQGLSYATETQSGVTDSTGAFTYKSGETIQFSIGNFLLGDAVLAVEDMTPVDLVTGVVLPTTTSELNFLFDRAEKGYAYASVADFNKLVNMLVFLHSIDSDKDASNDISIADGMGTLLEGVSIDFSDSWVEDFNPFTYELEKRFKKLKTVLADAVAQNLVDSALVKKPPFVLTNFYSAQGISQSFAHKDSNSYDNNADGTADSISTYTYDTSGNRLTNSYDGNANGTADNIRSYTYDSSGNQLTDSYDTNADGTASIINTYTYDSSGNRLTNSYDGNANGTADNIISYTYDSSGNELTQSYDANANGTADNINTYTYDTSGNRLTRSYDDNANGTADWIITYTYDSSGNRLTESYDGNANGTADNIRSYTYDSSGNRLTESYDGNADGTADWIRTYTYTLSVMGIKSTIDNIIEAQQNIMP